MNRTAHRIIFNARRRCLMAVAETASSIGKCKGTTRRKRCGNSSRRKAVSGIPGDYTNDQQESVTLPDGSITQALVPHVYLAAIPADLQPGGALLSGSGVTVDAGKADIRNSGTILGRTLVSMNAASITDTLGLIAAQKVSVGADDIRMSGTTVKADKSLCLLAQNSIAITSTTQTTGNSGDISASQTGIARVAGLYVSNSAGSLQIRSGGDTTLTATTVQSAGSVQINAGIYGGSLVMDTLQTGTTTKGLVDPSRGVVSLFGSISSSNTTGSTSTSEVGSTISGAGKVALSAGSRDSNGNVAAAGNLVGSNVTVTGNTVSLDATNAVAITSAQSTASSYSNARTTTSSQSRSTDNASSITATNGLSINADRLVELDATKVNAGVGNASVTSKGDIVLGYNTDSRQTHSTTVTTSSGFMSSSTTVTNHDTLDATAAVTSVTGSNVQIKAGGALNSYGTNLNANGTGTTGVLNVGGATQNFYAVNEVHQNTTQSSTTNSFLGFTIGTNERSDTRTEQVALGSQLKSSSAINVGVGKSATFEGSTLSAPVVNFQNANTDGKTGQVNLIGSVDTTQTIHTEKSETAGVYQSQSGSGTTTQTLNLTKINGKVTLDDNLAVSVQLPKTITTSGEKANTDAASNKTNATSQASVQQQIDELSQQPGLEYLGQLSKKVATDNPTAWSQVELAHDSWSYSQSGLTAAGAALLSIAIAAYTGGMGSNLLGGTAATAATATTQATAATLMGSASLATAANVGFTTLMSQAAVAMVNNGGDIGKTLAQLGSEQSVKNLLTAMVTAGALDKLNQTLGFSGEISSNGQTGTAAAGTNSISVAQDVAATTTTATAATSALAKFGNDLLKNVTDNVAGAAINSAITGKPLDEAALTGALSSALITAGMASLAHEIGDAATAGKDGKPALIDSFTQKVAHAVLGCAAGAATAGNSSGCAPGAVGAVVGEMAAEFAKETLHMTDANALAFAKVMSATSGVLVGGGGDNAAAVNIANTTGTNAAQNNFLSHTQAALMKKEFAACNSKPKGCSDAEAMEIITTYHKLSDANIQAVKDYIQKGDTESLRALESSAATANEVDAALPFGYGKIAQDFRTRQDNINIYGSIKGTASLFGSDIDQAQQVADFRKENCTSGVSASACNAMVKQALDDRMKRVGILTAVGALTPLAVNGLRTLGLPKSRSATTSQSLKTPKTAEILDVDGSVIGKTTIRTSTIEDPVATNAPKLPAPSKTVTTVQPAVVSEGTPSLTVPEGTGANLRRFDAPVAEVDTVAPTIKPVESAVVPVGIQVVATVSENQPSLACTGPGACFVAGTVVHTANGPQAIETFQGGELVYSRHEHTQETGLRPVVATRQTHDQALFEVVIENPQGQTETLHTTAEHPFWVVNAEGGAQWRKASLLAPGMQLVDRDGNTLTVQSQTALNATATVYNIQVQEHHTYHVGVFGTWVHNANCCEVTAQTPIQPSNAGNLSKTKLGKSEVVLDTPPIMSPSIQDIVVNGDITGSKTENLVNVTLHADTNVTVLGGTKYGANNGLDHVVQFVDPATGKTMTMVVDSKQLAKSGSTSLDPQAAGTAALQRNVMQLSDDSLRAVMGQLPLNSPAVSAIRQAQADGTLIKAIAYVDKTTGTLKIVPVTVP